MENTPDATEAVKRFEESEQATDTARKDSERDRDYYDGKQWTDAEKSALEKRGQPVVTFNRIQRKVNYLKGLEAQTRKDPKGFPRTPGDDGAAQAATDALRYVCDDQLWDAKRSDAYENIIVEGTGAIFVGAAQGKQGIDPSLIHIAWDRLYADPYSRRVDYSDAAYMGLVTWLDMSEALAKWKDREDVLETTLERSRNSDTYDDRPKYALWADYKRRRVRVCEEYYLKDGQWWRCVFTQAGYLEDPEPSPFLDEDGKPECPIKAISAYVDRDNNRYGEVRAMISPQDEVNKRRSKGLHLINSRQVRISPTSAMMNGVSSLASGAMDPSSIKRELQKPDGVVFGEDGEFEVLPTGDQAQANFEMLQEAKAEIDLLGPNAALAGKNENDSSGRAIMAQQQGGMIEVALLHDRLRMLSLSVYRAIWARIKQYWKEQRWIRVTDDERNIKWVGLNLTMLDVAAQKLQSDPQAQQKLALLAQDPRAQQVMENAVAEMDVDIIIDEGMDTPMVQAEQFETLSKIMPALVNLPPQYAIALVEASSLRDKDKILEAMEQMQQGNPMEAQMQAEQQKLQLEMQLEQAKLQMQNQMEQEKLSMQAQMEAAKLQQTAMLEREKMAQQAELKREEMQFDAQLESEKAQAKARLDAQLGMARMDNEARLGTMKAEIGAQVATHAAETKAKAAAKAQPKKAA